MKTDEDCQKKLAACQEEIAKHKAKLEKIGAGLEELLKMAKEIQAGQAKMEERWEKFDRRKPERKKGRIC